MATLSRRVKVFSDGSYQLEKPEVLRALLRRDQCYLWDSRYVPDGSFSMIGGRSPSNWLQIEPSVFRMIYSIHDNLDLQKWSASEIGKLYTGWDGVSEVMRWPIILISSTYTDIQHVRVLKIEQRIFGGDGLIAQLINRVARKTLIGNYRDAALIDVIPYQSSGDYSAYMPDKHPEYWLWAYTDYKDGGYGPSHTMPDGRALTFRMPLFNPLTFPKISTTAQGIGGFWVDARVLA